MPLLEFGPRVQIYPQTAPLNPHPLVEAQEVVVVPEEVEAGVVPHPLMEVEVEAPVETGRQAGVVEEGEELNRALCWGEEEVVHPYLVGRVEVGVGRRLELWRAEVEAALLGLWKGVGEERWSCEEVEEVVVLLWMAEVGVLEKNNRAKRYDIQQLANAGNYFKVKPNLEIEISLQGS